MGQGNYMGFVYGAVLNQAQQERLWKLSERHETVEQARVRGRVRAAYEARDHWLGVFIATPDMGLAEFYEVGSLSRQAISLVELPLLLRRTKHFQKAQQGYEQFREACGQHGLELPAGDIIAVFDYD